ncbi:MAG: hypothetical protein KA138_16605 [Saprospiraceae bacterium]|nr:hypothetical protein [Lewinellaceae bacterium]MBP6813153.1 hypothetical protein [Saprospiraceae bacterium]
MQRFLSILLVCGILGQASIRTAWTLHYQWNRATYVAQCINKDKPSLHCDGKCAFKKQMAAREKNGSKEPQLPENFREIKDIQLFFEFPSYLNIVDTGLWSAVALPPCRASLPDAPVADIFRPPA